MILCLTVCTLIFTRYKASVGYSDIEIKNKRESLENVLIFYVLTKTSNYSKDLVSNL